VRKGFMTGAICICAVAIPAVAVAGPEGPDPEYGGRLEDKKNHYFGFDVKGSGAERKIKNGFVINMPFDCEDDMGDGKQTGELRKAVDVKANGSFDETIKYDLVKTVPRGGPEKLRYRLAGDLDGDKASGFLRIELLGGPNPCDSGKQDFKAKRPAPTPPPGDFRR